MVGRQHSALESEGLDGVERGRGEDAALDDVELGAAAGPGGVDVIAHAGGGEGAAAVEEVGAEFGGQGVGRVGPAESL